VHRAHARLTKQMFAGTEFGQLATALFVVESRTLAFSHTSLRRQDDRVHRLQQTQGETRRGRRSRGREAFPSTTSFISKAFFYSLPFPFQA
jgi:hypothetical protein